MENLKKYGEIKGVMGLSEFSRFCGGLSLREAEEWDVEDLSTRLNKHYPNGAVHKSHQKNQWVAARSNIDRILENQKPSFKRWVFTHPLMTTILGTVIGGVILTGVLALPKYIVKDSTRTDPPVQTKEIDQPENTPIQIPLIN